MEIFSTIKETRDCLINLKKEGKTIGFVPTMGALHRGHISLLEQAKKENDISVSSIFVNPTQFNDKKDLEKYPRTIEDDILKLKAAHCDVLFAPGVEEMYPSTLVKEPEIDLGNLGKVMEGKLRPGHFQGVCTVVKKLFDIVLPNKAYFGEKDFQQLAVIKYMVRILNIPVEIIPCPTFREADGLAMSSRNVFLNPDERKNVPLIYKTMMEAKLLNTNKTISELKKWVEEKVNENPFLKLEYFEIVNSETLQLITDTLLPISGCRACIAVKVGTIRLIDNIAL